MANTGYINAANQYITFDNTYNIHSSSTSSFTTATMPSNGGYSCLTVIINDALIKYGTIDRVTFSYRCKSSTKVTALQSAMTSRTGYIKPDGNWSWKVTNTKAINGSNDSTASYHTDTFDGIERSNNGDYRLIIGAVNPIKAVVGYVDFTYVSVDIEYTPLQIAYSFVNYDGTKLKSGTVDYGSAPTAPSNPSKPSDVQYNYSFSGWSPAVGAITSSATYTAQYTATLRKYALTVEAGGVGGTVTGGGTYDYGKEVTLTATPTSDSVKFVKWSDGNTQATRKVTVTGNALYTAIFEVKSYAVTFKDDNGTVLKTETVQHGSKPTPPDNPEKADTAQWNYTFDGWYDDNGNKWTSSTTITGATTFTARYSSVVQKYTVRWFNHDGTLLETDENVPYGTKPTYNGATPTKAGNAQYSYRHIGWDYDLNVGITGAIDITAQFAQDINTYTVKWVNEGEVIETDELVPYGTQPDYNGATPTKESDAQFDYDFIGWNAEVNDPPVDDTQLETVKGNITYTAVYSKTTRIYPITVIVFDKNGIYVTNTYAFEYGKEISINALVTDVIGYKFVKWSDGNTDAFRVIQVTGEATYQAVYERSSIPLRVGTEQVTGVYIVPDTNTIVYVISGTVPTVTPTTDTVDGWNFEVSNSVPDNSFPLEKLYINRTRVW